MASSEPAGEPGGEAKPSPGKGGKVKYDVFSFSVCCRYMVFSNWMSKYAVVLHHLKYCTVALCLSEHF